LADISFTSKPESRKEFQVGDVVEVNCDHENAAGDRVRGWISGVVVQIDPKIVAVQFDENVYLTDGWMVPDHVLWFPHTSPNIRFARKKKRRQRSS